MLSGWIVFVLFGAGAAALCVRYMMIEAAMVAALMKQDPNFRPKYAYSLDPAARIFNVREYRRRVPSGPLTKKLKHTIWAFGVWAVVGIAWVLVARPSP